MGSERRRRGNLVVISAPSGSGKTTLRQALLERIPGVTFSISYTTRARRPTEVDGVDYHFVSESVFREKVARGDFLEWAEVHGKLYGTDRAETEAARARGNDVLLDVDVQGADQVQRAQPDAIRIFVLPPSFAVLEQRLRGRRQDDPDAIERRLTAARQEVTRYRDYDYVIINESLESSVEILAAIVLAERNRPALMEDVLKPVVHSFRSSS